MYDLFIITLALFYMLYDIFCSFLLAFDTFKESHIDLKYKKITDPLAPHHGAQKISISVRLMMAVLNFSHEIDPHLTYHIDPHASCTERGTHRPRTSIPNRLPVDVAEN